MSALSGLKAIAKQGQDPVRDSRHSPKPLKVFEESCRWLLAGLKHTGRASSTYGKAPVFKGLFSIIYYELF